VNLILLKNLHGFAKNKHNPVNGKAGVGYYESKRDAMVAIREEKNFLSRACYDSG